MNRFQNQTVLITGSTRGIGKSTAKLFADEGAHVIITGTSETCSDELMKEFGSSMSYVQGNFSTDEGIKVFLESLDAFERIDVCVNNAGINRLYELDAVPDDDYNELLSVNLHAPFQICSILLQE
jgi:3-oxoacyl-[acyl-carrier protein] reductase